MTLIAAREAIIIVDAYLGCFWIIAFLVAVEDLRHYKRYNIQVKLVRLLIQNVIDFYKGNAFNTQY